MTEKIARRGTRVPSEYAADFLDQVPVKAAVEGRKLVSLAADDSVEKVRAWVASHAPGSSHQGLPVVDAAGKLIGVLTRRDFLDPSVPADKRMRELVRRAPIITYPDQSLREAADHMVREGVGRLVVVSREQPDQPLGILTRSDLLGAHRRRLDEASRLERSMRLFSRRANVDQQTAAR